MGAGLGQPRTADQETQGMVMNTDLHKQRAAEIFSVPYEQVTDAQRKYAKTVNYVGAYTTPMTIGTYLLRRLQAMKENAK